MAAITETFVDDGEKEGVGVRGAAVSHGGAFPTGELMHASRARGHAREILSHVISRRPTTPECTPSSGFAAGVLAKMAEGTEVVRLVRVITRLDYKIHATISCCQGVVLQRPRISAGG